MLEKAPVLCESSFHVGYGKHGAKNTACHGPEHEMVASHQETTHIDLCWTTTSGTSRFIPWLVQCTAMQIFRIIFAEERLVCQNDFL